ncbi:glycosyltransferase family 2 protein [Arthrobacter echini]|uniref:Glycosyltransferase family 2 protein n=1 Tax=Arthrobacter echini TaxID=1529066 RepID=A0A4S5E7J7_9MICC|nr:glycosyltransferase family A protein [Arthrobacter echini]THJ67453.1 glycosyltransferase family 2 protein [Arthrobacter echini]
MNERLAVVIPVFNEPEITRTLAALHRQHESGALTVYVVDNGSTDDTLHRVERFAADHPNLAIRVLHEQQKGTGAASDTGFRAAIAAGHQLVARTDGDSEPAPDWSSRIRSVFASDDGVHLVGGRSVPLRDRYYRRRDDLLMPGALVLLRIMMTVKHIDPTYMRFVAGHNMAVRASAYLAVGGIGRTAIDQRDEDIDFSVAISHYFGAGAVRLDPRIRVATSMRRVRRYGVGLMGIHHLLPVVRGRLIRSVDVR